MKLFVISLNICVLVVYQKVALTEVLQNKMNISEHSAHEIIPDDVENLETSKPKLDKQELRKTIVQVIKDLYPKRDNNLPKILTLYSENLWLKKRPKQIVSLLPYLIYTILTLPPPPSPPKKRCLSISFFN